MKNVEISLKEVIVYTIRRWKIIIISSLLISLLTGGYVYFIQKQSNDLSVSVIENNTRSIKQSYSIEIPSVTNSNLDSYQIVIVTNDLLSKLGNRYVLIGQGAPLKELLDGKVPSDLTDAELHNYIKVESSSIGVVDIIVSGPDGSDLNEIVNTIYTYLKSKMNEVSKSVVDHLFTFIASTSNARNFDVLDAKNNEAIGYIQIAIVAFLIAIIIGIIIAGFGYVIYVPVQTPDQIQTRLNIRYLGGVQRVKRLSLVDKMAGTLRMGNELNGMRIIAANIVDFAGNKKRILVSGTVSEEVIGRFAKQLSLILPSNKYDLVCSADINEYAETIRILRDSDAVVLVERIDESRLKRIKDERDRIDLSDKEIIGYALY